jgi:hypothetical protein
MNLDYFHLRYHFKRVIEYLRVKLVAKIGLEVQLDQYFTNSQCGVQYQASLPFWQHLLN